MSYGYVSIAVPWNGLKSSPVVSVAEEGRKGMINRAVQAADDAYEKDYYLLELETFIPNIRPWSEFIGMIEGMSDPLPEGLDLSFVHDLPPFVPFREVQTIEGGVTVTFGWEA